MKKCTKLATVGLVTLIMAFLLVGCGGGDAGDTNGGGTDAAGKTYTLKLGHDQKADSPFGESAEKFKELVEERSEDQIKVEIYPSQQLGSAREMIEGLQMGTVEAVLLPTAKFGGFDEKLTLVDMPFLFPNNEVLWKVLDGNVGDELLAGLNSIGLKGISFYAEGFKHFTNNKEIHLPEDFEGEKIRVMEAPVIMAQYEAWGANPVPIDFAEVYNSLQQGVVSGQENPLLSIHDMKFYEVQDNLILSNHGYLAYVMVASDNWLQGLPEDLRNIVMETGKEVADYHKGLMDEANATYLQNIKDFGTNVYELTDEEKQAFFEASQPVYEEFEDAIGSDLLQEVLDQVEQYSN